MASTAAPGVCCWHHLEKTELRDPSNQATPRSKSSRTHSDNSVSAICTASASVPRTTYPRNQAQRTRKLPPADRACGHSTRGHEPAKTSSHGKVFLLRTSILVDSMEAFPGLAQDPQKTIHQKTTLDPQNSQQRHDGRRLEYLATLREADRCSR